MCDQITLYDKWNVSTIVVDKSGYYEVQELCNQLMFTNVGNTIVQVNDMVLFPGVLGVSLGDSRVIGGHAGEIYKGVIKVSFLVPLGTSPRLEIVQKFYIPKNE